MKVLITCILLLSFSSYAEVTVNVGATSNYLWRGLEQTEGNPAVFGGIDYSHDSGFYLGTWASNVSWSGGPSYEIDFYGGYADSVGDFEYDLGYIYYAYPDDPSDSTDLSEAYFNLTYTSLTFGAAVLSHGEEADFGDTLYLSADYNITVFNDAELTFHLGRYTGKWLEEDTTDFGLLLSKSGFTLGLSKVNAIDADNIKLYVSYQIDIGL